MKSYLGLLLLLPTVVNAQTLGRRIEGELSGNIFFGNTRQVLAALRSETERVDSSFAIRFQARYNYGETTTDAEGTVVSKRSWITGGNYDLRPFADFTPFLRGSVESSFENRIQRRLSAGGGARLNAVRDSLTDVIISAGVNGERTMPLPPGDSAGATTLARGATTLRLRRILSTRVTFASETSYSPALGEFDDYTILTMTSLKIKLASFAGLTVTFKDGYDSRAMLRGARSNNDGEILVGILTTF